MRLGQLLLALGIMLVLISFLGSPPVGQSLTLSNNSYRGFMFRAVTDIIVEAKAITPSANFSFFILDIDNTKEFVLNGTLNEARPLAEFSDLHEYADAIGIPKPGLYSVFLTTSHTEQIEVSFNIRSRTPYLTILLAGVVPAILGGALVSSSMLKEKRHARSMT
jgi:hypothetical protein